MKFAREVGLKQYEFTDHLGNVRTVISDLRLATDIDLTTGNITNEVDIEVINSYYAFGFGMKSREYRSSLTYRYGFNGMEKLNELSGSDNHYDLGERIYDSRIGRMFSIDPRTSEYAWQSPYVYHRNNPVNWIDYLGGGDAPEDQKVVKTADGGFMNINASSKVTTYSGSTVKGTKTGNTYNVEEGGVASFTHGEDKYTALFSSKGDNKGEFLGYYKNGDFSEDNKFVADKLIYEDQLDKGFKDELLKVSYSLSHDPNKLLAVMKQESNIKADAWNGTTAVGLIQFTSVALKEMENKLGVSVTKDELSKMTATEQLKYVEYYYTLPILKNKTFKTIEDYAMATFAPAFMGKPTSTAIFSKPSNNYTRNKYLDTDGDGKITVGEIGAKYSKKYVK